MMTATAMVATAIQGDGTTNRTAAQQRTGERELQNAARDLRDAIRHNVDQQLIQSRAEATAKAALAQAEVTPPTPPSPPFIFRRPDGSSFSIAPRAFDNTVPPQVVDISIAFFITMAVIIIGLPLARAFARRMDRKTTGGQVPTEIASQIAQLNQAVDAIAVEVERISEGQRFTTRLLTEQRDARQTLPSAAGR